MHHAPPASDQFPRGKCAGDARSDHDDVGSGREIIGRAVAQKNGRGVLVPVRVGAFGGGRAGLAFAEMCARHDD